MRWCGKASRTIGNLNGKAQKLVVHTVYRNIYFGVPQ